MTNDDLNVGVTEDLVGRLESPADAQRFIFAGNAILTLRSMKTGSRFTYRVKKNDDGKVFFVAVLTGPQNDSDYDYSYMGHFLRGSYTHGRKSKIAPDAPSAKAWDFFVKQLDGLTFHEALEVWHEGRCCRCGRTLTVPESVRLGIGPECAGKMGVKLIAQEVKKEAQAARASQDVVRDPIRVSYSSLDSYGKRWTKTYKTIPGARKWAVEMVGKFPNLGSGYAVSDDGIGKIEVRGCSLKDLFPGAE